MERVTPLAGVWIEILRCRNIRTQQTDTPLAGVWIEIAYAGQTHPLLWSLPLRECGLK